MDRPKIFVSCSEDVVAFAGAANNVALSWLLFFLNIFFLLKKIQT